MKNIILSSIFVFSISAVAQTLSMGTAINKAGRQRMIAQRMAKDYLAIGAGVNVDDATRELDESAALFNETLRDLELFSKNKETTDAVNFTRVLWEKFRINVMTVPSFENAENIIEDANNLTNACNILIEKIVSSSGSKYAVLPNICGKQRMLSQKIAMYYLANHWEVPYKNLERDLNDAITAFEGGLNGLVNSSENTDEINQIMKFQQSEWQFLKKTFDIKAQKSMPATVFSSTNMILKDFNRATTLYEKLVIASAN